MNVWVAGWAEHGGVDAGAAAGALRELLEAAGFLDPASVQAWTAPSGRMAAAWASHGPEQTGGVRYAAVEPKRLALFSGRPVRWVDEHRADGQGPIDPAFYLRPAREWDRDMDGRWISARLDDETGELEVACDAIGAYPLFRTTAPDGTLWFSGNANVLQALSGDDAWDVDSLAGLLGGGFPLTGQPWWRSVRRVDRGATLLFRPRDTELQRLRLPDDEVVSYFGAGSDPREAAKILVASLEGLADWPGRPNLVPITAGKDSRLVFAAALNADMGEWKATTAGRPGVEDVDRAIVVCEAAGIEHHIAEDDPHGIMFTRPARAAQVTALTGAGTANVADGFGFPLGPRDWVLPLWHAGHGSEVGRAVYGTGIGLDREGVVKQLYRFITTHRPGRPELVDERGAAIVRKWFEDFVDSKLELGARIEDVPDLFFWHERLGRWAGPSHAVVEWVKDTTSPTWSTRLLPHEAGHPVEERALQMFNMKTLEVLAPQLVDVPYEADRPWPARVSPRARSIARGREIARKAWAEAKRRRPRLPRRGPAEPPAAAPEVPPEELVRPPDPFHETMALVRERALSENGHAAWEVLDRKRVESLLGRDPATLDSMSKTYVWRLATVFLRDGER
jgi:hypothetical protein